MARDIWFHVGYPKAASTFLQRDVLPTSDEISQEMHRGNYHYLFAVRYPQPNHRALPFFARHEKFDENARVLELERLRDLVDESDRVVVFSNETMSMGGRAENRRFLDHPERIANRIQRWFPHAGILLVLRRQPDWVTSWYRDLVHSARSEWRTIEGVLEGRLWEDHVEAQLHYDRKLRFYRERFGRDRVRVVFFEELFEDPDRFVASVCNALGIRVPNWQNRRRNEGRSDQIIWARRMGNRLYHSYIRPRVSEKEREKWDRRWFFLWKRRIDRLQSFLRLSSKDRLMSDREKDRIEQTYRESNRRLGEMLGIDIGQYGYVV